MSCSYKRLVVLEVKVALGKASARKKLFGLKVYAPSIGSTQKAQPSRWLKEESCRILL